MERIREVSEAQGILARTVKDVVTKSFEVSAMVGRLGQILRLELDCLPDKIKSEPMPIPSIVIERSSELMEAVQVLIDTEKNLEVIINVLREI